LSNPTNNGRGCATSHAKGALGKNRQKKNLGILRYRKQDLKNPRGTGEKGLDCPVKSWHKKEGRTRQKRGLSCFPISIRYYSWQKKLGGSWGESSQVFIKKKRKLVGEQRGKSALHWLLIQNRGRGTLGEQGERTEKEAKDRRGEWRNRFDTDAKRGMEFKKRLQWCWRAKGKVKTCRKQKPETKKLGIYIKLMKYWRKKTKNASKSKDQLNALSTEKKKGGPQAEKNPRGRNKHSVFTHRMSEKEKSPGGSHIRGKGDCPLSFSNNVPQPLA